MTKTFDPACLALAEYFCSDHPHTTPDQLNDLAYTIQMAIEDWMEDQDNAQEVAKEVAYDKYIDDKLDVWKETGVRPSIRRKNA